MIKQFSRMMSFALVLLTLASCQSTEEKKEEFEKDINLRDASDYKHPQVAIMTTEGMMIVELYEKQCPNTVANFITLAESGFYNGLRFHRIIKGFMAQGGCPNSRKGAKGIPGTGNPGHSIAAEFTVSHDARGILSMARGGDINSAGSQFFICFAPQRRLDGQYAAFGKVTQGMEVIKKLENAASPFAQGGVPTRKDIWIKSISIIRKNNHPYTVKKH